MAAKTNHTEPVSTGYWMFAVFITALPLVNLIAIPVLAFAGSNSTKKNYYRAILAWMIVLLLAHVAFFAFGFGAIFYEHVRQIFAELRPPAA